MQIELAGEIALLSEKPNTFFVFAKTAAALFGARNNLIEAIAKGHREDTILESNKIVAREIANNVYTSYDNDGYDELMLELGPKNFILLFEKGLYGKVLYELNALYHLKKSNTPFLDGLDLDESKIVSL